MYLPFSLTAGKHGFTLLNQQLNDPSKKKDFIEQLVFGAHFESFLEKLIAL